ncbi:hypothetical protein ES332_A08G079700v1 [Gossypium tomentosum]|uniref:Uncharacterized protein n=1 Tax=Gossypium tomentosum TaxID=34277 RepID=A0A5D2PC40_GOSTO|nr:hypothetical protein ES332_A08G079700v1 [Gossypium tomentosum]
MGSHEPLSDSRRNYEPISHQCSRPHFGGFLLKMGFNPNGVLTFFGFCMDSCFQVVHAFF